ncbi:unnamed protein product [Allacma fusca]|uniref:Uncharacterized protein n=1 Tax=Allacma fusca TaxID=39272 RepID=A0A8J2K2C7_9HEXA|nr:unnamed protein product [Allacma fusca]
MPKKSKKYYGNFSTVHAPGTHFGHDQIWDDSELIDQFDEALRDWKEERRLGSTQTEVNYDTDPDDVPDIGPWVEVPVQKYNPDNALESSAFPSANDMELMNLYDKALLEWREEREPDNWKKYLESLVSDASSENDNSARPGPWVVVEVEDESQYHTGNSSDSQEISHDLEVVTIYDDALQEWKEERGPTQPDEDTKSSQENPNESNETL